MKVTVLAKWVPEPQGTPELGADNLLVRAGANGALDPGDEFGVEAALQAVEAQGGEVTVVSMGPAEARDGVQRALAMGAHKGVLVSDDSLRGSDTLVTAKVLAAAVRRGEATPDLVIASVESTDGYTGTLPLTIAELLDLPAASFARKIEVGADSVRIEQQTELGYDVIEVPLPAVVTVTAGANEPRYPSMKGILAAKKAPLEEISVSDLGLSADDITASQSVSGTSAAPEKAAGEVIEAGDDAAVRIADLLAEAKVI